MVYEGRFLGSERVAQLSTPLPARICASKRILVSNVVCGIEPEKLSPWASKELAEMGHSATRYAPLYDMTRAVVTYSK